MVTTTAVVVAALTLGSPPPAVSAADDATISGAVSLEGGSTAGAGEVRVEAYPAPAEPANGEMPIEPNPIVLASTTTDEHGQYALSGLSSGLRYRVKFSLDASSPFADVWWTDLQDEAHPYSGDRSSAGVIVGQSAGSDASITLPRAARITGLIEMPEGAGWVQASAIRLGMPVGEPAVIVQPNPDGQYDLGRLIPGDYQISIDADRHLPMHYGAPTTDPGAPGVLRAEGGSSYVFSGRPFESAAISGTIVCPNCQTLLSSSDSRIQLERWDASHSEWISGEGTWTTDNSYSKGYLYPGTYRTRTVHHERWHVLTDVSPPIEVHEGDQVTRRIVLGGVRVERISGADRFATAASVSLNYVSGVPVVFIASGEGFADALAAGPVAAKAGGPILLVTASSVPDATRGALTRLQPQRIVIVGGTSAVSNAVAADLESFAPQVDRIGGADRYDTSRRIARFAFDDASAETAYVASGLTFADAVSAGAAAAHRNAPVILVNGANGGIDAETSSFITELGVETVHVVGGPAVVHPGIQSSLSALPGVTALRHGGDDRYATARLVNSEAIVESEVAFLASGLNYPDALAGAAYAGSIDAPLFLIPGGCVPNDVLAELTRMQVARIYLLGGTEVVTPAVQDLRRC